MLVFAVPLCNVSCVHNVARLSPALCETRGGASRDVRSWDDVTPGVRFETSGCESAPTA